MAYKYYKIINTTEFDSLSIPSIELTLNLEDVGEVTVMVTRGAGFGLLYNGVYLVAGLGDQNPFEFEGYACYISETFDLYLGILVDET